jgi:diguanylate cyclase (GGDEF)-like protein
MHLGTSRWTFPLLAAVAAVGALLTPALIGRAVQTPLFLFGAALCAAGAGYLLGSKEDELRALAALDPLTGLGNRRRFDERLNAEVGKAQRDRTPLSLLVIDLDHLKGINDGLGHAAGDRALLAVADALKHTSRPADLVARWGGDEFAVVAPCTSEEQARALGERIASTVHLRSADRRPMVELGTPVIQPSLSVSVGVASADSDHPYLLTAEALFAAADHALLQAKASGKGCVRAASGVERRPTARGSLRLVSGKGH